MAGTYAPHDEVYTQRHTLATLQRNPHLLESTSSAGGTVCDLFTFQATCMSCSVVFQMSPITLSLQTSQ